MNLSTSLEPNYIILIAAVLGTLAIIFSCGWLLLPQSLGAQNKLLRAGLIGASGMLFVSSATASIVLHRMNYLALIPIVQIGFRLWSFWQQRRAGSPTAATRLDRWTRSDIIALIGSVVAVTVMFQLPLQRSLHEGTTREVHSDLGFYAQQVLAIQEAGVADQWSAVLGPQTQEAGITKDFWYHWGAIFLAIGVKDVFGIPAISALLDVTGSVMNILLLLCTSAIAAALVRGKTSTMLLIGALSLLATQVLRSLDLQTWLNTHLPYGTTQHSKFALAAYFSYKFEAVALLAALSAWINRFHLLAITVLFCACVSAPHTVAACGIAGGATLVIGVLLRNQNTWKTGAALIAVPSCAWFITVRIFGASMAGEGASILVTSPAAISSILLHGSLDAFISLGISMLSLPGILHLIIARDEDITPEARTLGWMALVSIASACIAFHLLQQMTDRHHVTLFIHAILVMPVGIWGAARLFKHSKRGLRTASLAIITASALMGTHDLMLPILSNTATTWKSEDLAAAKRLLKGAPLGYIAEHDRGWWIPERGVMASIIESRIVRLNPLKGEQKVASSVFYGYGKPLMLLKPTQKENAFAWTLRFAHKLGVQHLIEFPNQPLPPVIAQQAKLKLTTQSFKIYKLESQYVAIASHDD